MVSLTWSPRKESDIQHFKIRKSLVRSSLQPNGQIVSRADYQLEPELDHLLISLPSDRIVPDAFYWNGAELAEGQAAKETQPGSGTYRLAFPATLKGAVLSVAYHHVGSTKLNWSERLELSAPTFPGEVWIEKTFWEIALPVDQHLFTLPKGFTPEFSWTRQGLFWSRTENQSSKTLSTWMPFSHVGEAGIFPAEGNTYCFSYYGPCDSLRFSAMNRSIIVLFGAGLALLMGFFLLKIPFTRNVLTVLMVVFAFAACGVWFMAPMQVLLQPAGLGLLLAIVAVLMDGSLKKSPPADIALPSPEDYAGSSVGSLAQSYPEVIGSEDPTAVRQVPAEASEPQSSRSGSSDSSPALMSSSIMENPE